MKKLAFLAFIMILLLPLLTACRTEAEKSYTPIPAGTYSVGTQNFTAPDDLFIAPGGFTYAANAFGANASGEQEPNPWPPIESIDVAMVGGPVEHLTLPLNVSYRDYIESKAGQTRNNIFWISRVNRFENNKLVLYSGVVPEGIEMACWTGSGMPGSLQAILMITISPEVAPGEYALHIGIELDGKDYGTVPCTIKVIE